MSKESIAAVVKEAIEHYKGDRNLLAAQKILARAVHSGRIDLGFYDRLVEEFGEALKQLFALEGEEGIATAEWDAIKKKSLTELLSEHTERDIDVSSLGTKGAKNGSIPFFAPEAAN